MQTENRFFDDLARLMNGAAGTMAGVGREAEAQMRERARGWIGGMDFIARDEFEAVKAMAVKALDEVDALRAELATLRSAQNPSPYTGERPAKGGVGEAGDEPEHDPAE